MRALLLIGLTAAGLAAAPVPKGPAEKPRAWKPTAGTRIVETVRGAQGDVVCVVADPSAAADGSYTFTLSPIDSPAAGESRLRVGKDVTTDVSDPAKPSSEIGYYRPGLKVGDTYTAPGELIPVGGKAEYVVEAEEDVKVPAGTFRAFRIRVSTKSETRRYWLSYEVGLVRITDADGETMLELKSYTRGK